MNFLLKHLKWANEDKEEYGDLRITKGHISEIGKNLSPARGDIPVNFDGHFVYPGLINGHDHFEMNLFPRLGKPPYSNSQEWALDIHATYPSLIKTLQKVPVETRLEWSAIKNIISGASVAVHHDLYRRHFNKKAFPIKVLKNYTWAHSIYMDKKIDKSFIKNGYPFIFHAAEGIDEETFLEIDKLDAMGVLNENTVIVHGIALSVAQINKLSNKKVSLIWCPSSNSFLFHRTAPISEIKNKIRIGLGTDSTLTGLPTLWEEMRFACESGLATPHEIFEMVSSTAADIFKLRNYSHRIDNSIAADLLVLPITRNDIWENLIFSTPSDIKLFLIDGFPQLVDCDHCRMLDLSPNIRINKISKWINVHAKTVVKKIGALIPEEYLVQNPLWKMIEA
jgi:cytosine/adenosine deaminase-related metal-dependent hydrolase